MKKITTLICLLGITSIGISQSTPNRNNDPVVISGSNLSVFSTLTPTNIVGFKYTSGNWQQVPIQIDERALLDIVTPYGALATGVGFLPPPPSPSNPKIYFYCDAQTNVGADATPTFDSDDELVFMVKDAGELFNGTNYPAGTVSGSCFQIQLSDPLTSTNTFIYLFQNDGSLQQNAGVSYVSYSSNLTSTSGFPANADNVVNPENTLISTPKYSWHFASEWVSDELKILLGSGVDILDRHKAFFANGTPGCARHEELFSSGENAFIINKQGPVRVVRSYMGAKSGPVTQRTHFFYEGRHDIVTNLRVHYIPSIYDAFDYNSDANGMIYSNSNSSIGVTIDGTPDVITSSINPSWEQIQGPQGTLSILHRINTTLAASEATVVPYYDDNSASPASNCTGTQGAWGTSGLGVLFASGICTGCTNINNLRSLETRRIIYVDSPNAPKTTAGQYDNLDNQPISISYTSPCQVATSILESKQQLSGVTLFPNPTNGTINIEGMLTGEAYTITIFNILGEIVETIYPKSHTQTISIKKSGLYHVVVSSNKGSETHKILVMEY